ncbi:hypothetical protein JOB18_005972 [Solea senegalensis]|uniref:Uncharacterized protein n=1 Tax=Solea senegalensis TaxID=28829 RepID=A0AAV6RJU7_SOLSE|nr:hypothetical protein JOB18_005972 [Solea senegalensis]
MLTGTGPASFSQQGANRGVETEECRDRDSDTAAPAEEDFGVTPVMDIRADNRAFPLTRVEMSDNYAETTTGHKRRQNRSQANISKYIW